MVGTEAKKFENLRSVHCRKKRSFRASTIFSCPIIDKLQNVFGYRVCALGECYLQANFENLVSIYIVRKCSFIVFAIYRISRSLWSLAH